MGTPARCPYRELSICFAMSKRLHGAKTIAGSAMENGLAVNRYEDTFLPSNDEGTYMSSLTIHPSKIGTNTSVAQRARSRSIFPET
jgi:hypothetical protein